MKKVFIRGSKAYYAREVQEDELWIRIEDEDYVGADLSIIWKNISGTPSPILNVYEDAWSTLAHCGDLIKAMNEDDFADGATEEDVAQLLRNLGYEDITEYERPKHQDEKSYIDRYYEWLNKPKETPQNERILFGFLRDFTDRRGLRQEWDQIDDDIQEEILETWDEIITKEL